MSPQIAWVALVTAGLLDVGWAIAMKYADGYTRLGWSIASLVLLAAFVFLLGRALQVLEIGVAYTVWTGIGAVGTLTMGVLLFGEALSPMKIAGIVLVMIGIVALKFAPALALRRADGAKRNPPSIANAAVDGLRCALPILQQHPARC